ncbi:hypothetical protein [Microbulbifer discodermiae]|uniref:hypothetical protein n=1 Tax=Microbulbifer sp. 2201CG32-9 TaxID=3232309 RepID=UPI00345BC31D
MTETVMEMDMAAPVEVPKEGKVRVNYTLKPRGDGEKWLLRDAHGNDADILRLKFLGVKEGGPQASGKAVLVVQLVDTDLVFADKQMTEDDKYDGMEICGECHGGSTGIKRVEKVCGRPQTLKIRIKAPSQETCGFSFKWAAQDPCGQLVLSADPDAELDPL